jgi:hypothetical protein
MKFWLLSPTQNQVLRSQKKVLRLKSHLNKHWPAKSCTQLGCCLCCSHGQRKGRAFKCARSEVRLGMVPCFVDYHTTVSL